MNRKLAGYFLIFTPMLIGLVVALFSPLDVLASSLPSKVVSMSQWVFPTVEKMRGGYALEQVALLYFSVMWLLLPVLIIGGYLLVSEQSETFLKNARKRKLAGGLFAAIFFPSMAALMMFVNFESSDLGDFRSYSIYHTRLGMGVVGFIIPSGAAMGLAISLFWWTHVGQIFQD